MTIFTQFQQRFESLQVEEFSLKEYLELCKQDPGAYASAAERMLLGIGEQTLVDTARDPRLSRIFSNKVIKRYAARFQVPISEIPHHAMKNPLDNCC
jgi:serine protein kinase